VQKFIIIYTLQWM